MLFANLYFTVKPYLPKALRNRLRRRLARFQLRRSLADWPIDESAGRTPVGWKGWPNGKRFAVVLTHDVESPIGFHQCRALADVEDDHGFRSSFNLIPEGPYTVTPEVLKDLRGRGFEIGIHDLRHDGKLYRTRRAFQRAADRINQYLDRWDARGFRSALMLHNLGWLHDLHIEYDASTFDTDPFEPQPDGAATIFPYWVARRESPASSSAPPTRGYVELPYTLPQDSTLFLFLGQTTPDLWKRKVDWLAARGGMVLLNLHPDYVDFGGSPRGANTYPVNLYTDLLRYIENEYGGDYWHALPAEVAGFIRATYPEGGPRRPLKACMLSYSFFDTDTRVQRYATALASRGDSVDVLSIKSSTLSTPPSPARVSAGSLPDGINVPSRWIRHSPGIRVLHVQERSRNEKKATDYAVRTLGFMARSALLLHRLDKLRAYDIIHVHNIPDFLVFATLLARRRGCRVILDLHDLLPEFYSAKFGCGPNSLLVRALRWIERLSCNRADHVIVSNHLWRDRVAARTDMGERCTAMVNHVDAAPYRAIADERRSRPPTNGHSIAAFPGGFYRHQGLHVAIEALVEVRKRFPGAELHLLGDGPERNSLLEQIGRLGLDDAAKLLPPVPLTGVPAFLANATLGIVPKLADGFGNEAYSTKIMEFMAAGLPVIASRTRIDEYYFRNGEVHFFQPGNSEALARAWIEVLERPQLRADLAAHGVEYVSEHGWHNRSADYLALVDRLLEAPTDQ